MSDRYLIAGSGIAALAAAESIRGRSRSARIQIVSEEEAPFYSRPGLAYFLSGEVPEQGLVIRTSREIKGLRVDWVRGSVRRLEPSLHEVELSDGRRLPWDRLLLATGAESLRPSFPGATLQGVASLDSRQDAARLVRAAKKGRRAVVVGGGSTALEIAEGLHARGMRVDYLLRGDRYWSKVLDEAESSLVERRLEASGIVLHRRTEIAHAVGKDGRIVGVETTAGERIPCELLVVAIGVTPRVALARKAGLAVDRGILVDECLRTSAANIFAAGDVAQVYDPAIGRAVLDTLWSSAEAQGRIAGENMAGNRRVYRKRVATNTTRLAGLVVTIIGDVGGDPDPDLLTITRGQSEAWSSGRPVTSLLEAHGCDRVRLCLGERAIAGAVLVGDQSLAEPLGDLIAESVDIGTIREELIRNPDTMAERVLAFHREWTAARSESGERALVAS